MRYWAKKMVNIEIESCPLVVQSNKGEKGHSNNYILNIQVNFIHQR